MPQKLAILIRIDWFNSP